MAGAHISDKIKILRNMAKKVPKKNIESVLVDIKKRDFNYEKSREFLNLNLRRIAGGYNKGGGVSWGKIFKWGVGLVVSVLILLGAFAVVNVKSARVALEAKGETISENFFRSFELIKKFEPGEAQVSLQKSKEKLQEIDQFIYDNPRNFVLSAGFKFVPFLKDVGGFLKQITRFNINLIRFSALASEIQYNGFVYFQNDGARFLDLVNQGREVVEQVRLDAEALRNSASDINKFTYFDRAGEFLKENYFAYSNDLYVVEDFLTGVINLFDSEESCRILLMFQNSSELRPAGGFLGSYGELVVQGGQMKELVVEDIYWPDHPMNFDEKYIAPEPLQRITKDWGARDANWFFNFPTSAETTMNMLEDSKIYKENNVQFKGVIGIGVNVLATIMKYVGPIELEEYGLTVNYENFLAELQREVETGKDKQAGENPKKILAVLAPKILERFEGLSDGDTKKLIEDLGEHIKNKDIMFYAQDKQINNLFRKYNIAGEVYTPPDGFWGSYLAVVNANIAGGKSDAFVNQNINLWLNVNTEGGVLGDINITREHNGEDQEDLWYRESNKDYIKIFTNSDSNLIFSSGGDERYEILEEYDDSYEKLETLQEIEETKIYNKTYNIWTTNEFGKQAFATWLLTEAGERSNLEIQYENPTLQNFSLQSGKKFQFVFDKQSGSDTGLNLKISAPLGYIWEESDSSMYKYETDNPSKRLIVDLTLKNQFEEEVIKQ